MFVNIAKLLLKTVSFQYFSRKPWFFGYSNDGMASRLRSNRVSLFQKWKRGPEHVRPPLPLTICRLDQNSVATWARTTVSLPPEWAKPPPKATGMSKFRRWLPDMLFSLSTSSILLRVAFDLAKRACTRVQGRGCPIQIPLHLK